MLFVGTIAPVEGLAADFGKLMPAYWAKQATERVIAGGERPATPEVALLAAYALLFLLLSFAAVRARESAERGMR